MWLSGAFCISQRLQRDEEGCGGAVRSSLVAASIYAAAASTHLSPSAQSESARHKSPWERSLSLSGSYITSVVTQPHNHTLRGLGLLIEEAQVWKLFHRKEKEKHQSLNSKIRPEKGFEWMGLGPTLLPIQGWMFLTLVPISYLLATSLGLCL